MVCTREFFAPLCCMERSAVGLNGLVLWYLGVLHWDKNERRDGIIQGLCVCHNSGLALEVSERLTMVAGALLEIP